MEPAYNATLPDLDGRGVSSRDVPKLAIALSKDPRGIRVTGLRSRILSQLSNTDSVSPVGVCVSSSK